MDYTAKAPTAPSARIATGSNASAHHTGKSFGVAVDVVLIIEQIDGSLSIVVVASGSFHLPVSDIGVAERIGVLVGMDLILSYRDENLHRILRNLWN